ncbi:BTB/POZ domain-containing protein 19 isoform X3 [Ailuropoda melanoleuca]|uniref:BTB/POZ domain-containing protein 19 isoform X3 n=1 Tax=Ailuropoda melanoleuca TaxID=9646 RepID=UPI0014948B4F|nr:BTB/POZ domain-containing protein 19 isoform X3 [Ailuropoda melanoleuca]
METPGLAVHGEAAPFSTALRSLLNNPQYSDVCFVVGQERQEVFAHRCLLACRCNFFQRLLGPKLGPGTPSPVVLSTVPAEAFLAVLEFLYTNSVRLHRHSVLEVLTAAVEYGLEELREGEKKGRLLGGGNMVSDRVEQLCLEFVVKVLDVELVCEALQEALRTRGFLELSAPALLPLLRSDKLCVDEAELVLAARSWARVGAVSWGYGGPRGGDAEGGLGRGNPASGWRGWYPARPGLGLALAGRDGAARGRGGGPGGAGAETGLTGPGGAERPGRAEPAGAAHPGRADRGGVEVPRSAERGCGPGRPVSPPQGNPASRASLLSGPAL